MQCFCYMTSQGKLFLEPRKWHLTCNNHPDTLILYCLFLHKSVITLLAASWWRQRSYISNVWDPDAASAEWRIQSRQVWSDIRTKCQFQEITNLCMQSLTIHCNCRGRLECIPKISKYDKLREAKKQKRKKFLNEIDFPSLLEHFQVM